MAMIKKYQAQVTQIDHPLADVFIVSLKSLDKPFRYAPGQFLHLALDEYDPSQPWPESRCFSMQSNEQDELIKITYSVKGRFTRRMAEELKTGRTVWLKLPYGELFLKAHDKTKTVFIAGGTGVTPFLSLFTDLSFKEYEKPILYLGIKNSDYHLYRNELNRAVNINPGFKVIIIEQESAGMLNIENIYQKTGVDHTFFISGPPLMIKNFKTELLNRSVCYEQIRTDEWE